MLRRMFLKSLSVALIPGFLLKRFLSPQPVEPIKAPEFWAQGNVGDLLECEGAQGDPVFHHLMDGRMLTEFAECVNCNTRISLIFLQSKRRGLPRVCPVCGAS